MRRPLIAPLLALIAAMLAACGGGECDPAPTGPQVAFYGDSLTVNRTLLIASGAFTAADYAKWGQPSTAPLHPADRAPIVVIRYGMADAILGMPPEQTVANVAALAAQVRRQGRVALIVGMPCLDSELGAATAQALRAIQTVDVATGCAPAPRTTDGIHPTTAEHARMDALIRAAVLESLNA